MRASQLKTTGFTLVELLVVISIIGLLVALLMPALASARHSAQLTVCSTKPRDMSLAVLSYASDNKDVFPLHYWWSSKSDQGGVNTQQTMPGGKSLLTPQYDAIYGAGYVSDNSAFFCPTQKNDYWVFNGINNRYPFVVGFLFRWNYALRPMSDAWPTGAGPTYSSVTVQSWTRLSSFNNAARTALAADRVPAYNAAAAQRTDIYQLGHQYEGVNVGYIDASVRWLKFDTGSGWGSVYWPNRTSTGSTWINNVTKTGVWFEYDKPTG